MNRNVYLVLSASVAAIGGLLFGYDTGVINGTQLFFSEYFELSGALKGWVVGCALLGCFVGAIAASYINKAIGRKNTLIVSAILFTISAWGSGLPEAIFPQSVSLLVTFRLIGGLGIGIASMTAPMYIAEISPAHKRGTLVTLYQLAIVTGFFVVFLATYFIGGENTVEQNVAYGWRVMFWSELVPCALFLLLLFIVPKSPRWLALNNRRDEANRILHKLHKDEYAEQEMKEINEAIELEQKSEKASIYTKAFLPLLLIGSFLCIFQQFTGINAVLYYGSDIFEQALGFSKDDVLQQQILLGGVNFLFTFVAMYTVDSFGRKPLIIIGSIGMIAGFMMLGVTLMIDSVGIISLLGILLFIGSFALSMGPVVWVLISEIFPNNLRGAALSFAVAVQWAANFMVSQLFPVVAESEVNNNDFWNQSLPYFLFTLFIIGLIIFTIKFVPETKGKSLEQLEKMWRKESGSEKTTA